MSENIIGALNDHDVGIKEQDQLLPIANVGRIMKQTVPQRAKISKEAKETMQECVSEFIGFVTSEASQKCRKERRKTVNGDDICWALTAIGFDDYEVPLKLYLRKFRELEGEKAAANQTKDKEDERYPLKFSFTGSTSSSKGANFKIKPFD
ncbi:Nuclear transcription factor Y subunit B-3 [Hibiscus syriacus]|uniref:Nuclear transcription factor Y subunit B-3 n=1 Tax=Hibiscus syriacus TaxID=106335 RepID=A0A6A3B606_HIBSY|nr:nuclear transcription factor Y subunit B-5-like [Hibiscus syriacus]KAE8712380.1 Nuclear transcription factor Y subunit B-3 [Hibiscus syriacus]